jgi:hypothetical protein
MNNDPVVKLILNYEKKHLSKEEHVIYMHSLKTSSKLQEL